MDDKNISATLGKTGCAFRSNIESHIKDYELLKGDDVEWLLNPLDELSHPAEFVLDAYRVSNFWESYYELYFHFKDAASVYVPFDNPPEEPIGEQVKDNTFNFDESEKVEFPSPNPFVKSMIIKGDLEPHEASTIPSIWNDMVVPFTAVGIWQAVLLHHTITFFPKGWHAGYMEKSYVFSLEDMQNIVDKPKRGTYDFDPKKHEDYKKWFEKEYGMKLYVFDQEKLTSYLNKDDILPSVRIDGNKAVVTYYYWNRWSGFCRATIPVEKHGYSVKFGEFEREKLVEYNCGWNY